MVVLGTSMVLRVHRDTRSPTLQKDSNGDPKEGASRVKVGIY